MPNNINLQLMILQLNLPRGSLSTLKREATRASISCMARAAIWKTVFDKTGSLIRNIFPEIPGDLVCLFVKIKGGT